jgi:NAD(P)-dependent dehydrogenase (short-subunit alcohol dehydrogenase family)
MKKGSVKERVALVTGASSGIGRATAILLARAGTAVVLSSRNEAALLTVKAEIESQGGRAWSIPADVEDESQVDQLVRSALDEAGRIDVVVCSAGDYLRCPVQEATVAEFRKAMEVNFYGSLRPILGLLQHMVHRGSGHIVVISSIDGKKGLPPDGPYVAAKFALTGFIEILRQELRGTGVHVTTVLPGRVDTPMIQNVKVPLISAKIPPERVARAVLRAIRRHRAELVIPFLGPKVLVIASSIWAPVGDWVVRTFKLGGVEETA